MVDLLNISSSKPKSEESTKDEATEITKPILVESESDVKSPIVETPEEKVKDEQTSTNLSNPKHLEIMSEMTSTPVDKVFCMDRTGSGNDLATLAALSNGGMNGQWNNPFVYLVWMMFANRFFGNDWNNHGHNSDAAAAALSADNGFRSQLTNIQDQIASFQTRMQDNHNTDLIMAGINGNSDAIRTAADKIGCSANALQLAINDVRSGIDKVAGQVGFTSERIINAVNAGDASIVNAVQSCCCNTQQSILKMGYDNQLATLGQTNELTARINTLANSVTQGFSASAYETQRQTCDIINAGNANTQRIVDVLNSHWNNELNIKYEDAKRELSQSQQTAAILAALKPNC